MAEVYNVLVPITGYLSVQVETDTSCDAVRLAIESAKLDYLSEWEPCMQVVKNGVSQAVLDNVEWSVE
ncbi:MAG: hypothetical protein ACRCX2_00015 [Paraclostridium sp.]